jgi:hypothetical protein
MSFIGLSSDDITEGRDSFLSSERVLCADITDENDDPPSKPEVLNIGGPQKIIENILLSHYTTFLTVFGL